MESAAAQQLEHLSKEPPMAEDHPPAAKERIEEYALSEREKGQLTHIQQRISKAATIIAEQIEIQKAMQAAAEGTLKMIAIQQNMCDPEDANPAIVYDAAAGILKKEPKA